uniref:Integrase catalytic domain-containing protein n=1 Tax=Cannabis sativa TaxID=3483 RepID=A0A803QCW3_CANSA
MSYLRSIARIEISNVMHEIHEGFSGDHTSGPSLSKKIIRQRYFCPTMKKDCTKYVHKYEQCHHYSKVPRAPPMEITFMINPWPFAVWGIDLVGSYPTGKGGVKFTIVDVDYFTKWVEAKPMNIATYKKDLDFVIKNIMCRYGLSHKIVFDNKMQFDNDKFTDFCVKHEIVKSFSAMARPQENGKVEAINNILKTTLKKKLQACKAHWLEELPRVLWAYRTTKRTSTGHTPYSMTYGSKAVILVESIVPSHRRESYDPTRNHALLQESLDLHRSLVLNPTDKSKL